MLIRELRRDFYDIIKRDHLCVIASDDVDAVCTFKILQVLLRSNHALYSLTIVSSVPDLHAAMAECSVKGEYILLVNCGATLDSSQLLSSAGESVLFVLDSHRPFHADSIDDKEDRIRLLLSEDEDDVSDAGDSEDRLLYHSRSSAVLMFELAWKLGIDCEDALWWACVGLTSQLLEAKINSVSYEQQASQLSQHLHRHNRSAQEQDNVQLDRLNLFVEKDVLLRHFRQWSLLDSLRFTTTTACYFKSWTMSGECRLLAFLADLGIPLVQCQQRYGCMDGNMRKEVKKNVESKLEKHGLNDLIYLSFSAQYSYSHRLTASDAALAAEAALRMGDKNLQGNFLTAMDCLSKHQYSLLEDCVGRGQSFLKIVWSEVKSLLSSGQVLPHGSFLLTQLPRGWSNLLLFSDPNALLSLGHTLHKAFCSQKNGHKHRAKPLVIMLPKCTEWLLVAGVDQHGSLGESFRRAWKQANCRASCPYFYDTVIHLKHDDKGRFCNALGGLLDS